MTEKTKKDGFTIQCDAHNYITLRRGEDAILCLDNSIIFAEEMIERIQEKTGMNFKDIPIKGSKDDFQGLRFLNGGWNRDFWEDFPDQKEIRAYMKMKNGLIFPCA